ncbi:hypothetical protein [Methanosarcina mazei]|uniref:hypothetical protein n=1 Tax=Methanosarcina mazei TaxID=2209 RepID=UPI003C7564FA
MLPEIAGYIFKTATTEYLDKIKRKEEQPDVSFAFINGSYKIDLYEGHENVLLKLKILFKNSGKSPTTVMDIVANLKYREESLQYLGNTNPIIRSKRLDNPTPLEIGPGVAKQEEFHFEFENVYTEYLDRISLPVSPIELCEMLEDKTKWPKMSDLPLNITIIGETLTQIITTTWWIYNEDQEKSKIIGGTLDFRKM